MATASTEAWRKRLDLPAYQVGEAARYTHIHPNTVAAWHKIEQRLLTARQKRAQLSYLQLIELAVVAGFRKAKFRVPEIRAAREFIQKNLHSRHPFAEFKFRHYGKSLFTNFKEGGAHRLFKANQEGQLAWEAFIGPVLQEFDYEEDDGVAVRWHVAGAGSPIIIDPRVSFGAPSVGGTPTWIIKGRWDAQESDSAIADDFGLDVAAVRAALKFEGVIPGSPQPARWIQ